LLANRVKASAADAWTKRRTELARKKLGVGM
jgi:hypothetical protein